MSSLLIESLRGAVTQFELPFEKNKKLILIYGENGTGKSTVCDAFDLLGNGKVGSLDTRGLGVTRKYWPTLGKTFADVKVTLATSGGDCCVSLNKADVVVSNPSLRPLVAVLRRAQILGLIEAKPADRYKEISRFVDVSGIEDSEAALRKLISDKARENEIAVARVGENRSEIQRFWQESRAPVKGADALSWAKQEVLQDRNPLAERKRILDQLITLWDALLAHPQKIAGLDAQLQNSETELVSAQESLSSFQETVARDYMELLDLLKAAQAHFRQHPIQDACPLCGSSENVEGLVEKIDMRIESQGLYRQMEQVKRTVAEKKASVLQNQQRLDDAKESVQKDTQALQVYCCRNDIPPDITMPAFPLPADTGKWSDWQITHQPSRDAWSNASEAIVEDRRFIATLSESLKVLELNERNAKEFDALLPHLKKILELVEGERKKFTDTILAGLSTRVGELYEAVHPGEGVNKIGLALDSAKRASLEITTEFGGKLDTPPQAYFSDSHLDTLGLCVFLALAERDSPESKILVLDDVLGSVDEPHVDRVIEMIYDVTAKFRHCLVTTHYGPWRHKYRWGWLKNGQCQFLELTRWSFSKGITHSRSVPEAERLRRLLVEPSPDHQAICAKAGVVLEAVLDFLTQLYECNVPRRAGNSYTLGDLLPAIDGKLKKALRVEHRIEDGMGVVTFDVMLLEPHITKIAQIAQIRNVAGCHFNALSYELLDSDAVAFGTEVLALTDALIDHEIGWPRNGKSGSYWATTGETRRLHPLKKPS
ncbi:MAG: AAA family ATPase [Actinomycetota bacterium]|nr:AAA family ATPase [Actinomycetota bacterium]